MISVETFRVGFLETNCYIIHESHQDRFAIVDPGEVSNDFEKYIDYIGKDKVDYIFLTHGHFDHIGATKSLSCRLDCKIVISERESEFLQNADLNLSSKFAGKAMQPFYADILVNDKDILMLGNEEVKVFEVPGHTLGSVCYIVNGKIFSGDMLLFNGIGRVDLPTGSMLDMKSSIQKISNIDDNYVIYPGHGNSTTLKHEKQKNAYFRKDNDEFLF